MKIVTALAVKPAMEPTKFVAKFVITSILTNSSNPDVSIVWPKISVFSRRDIFSENASVIRSCVEASVNSVRLE